MDPNTLEAQFVEVCQMNAFGLARKHTYRFHFTAPFCSYLPYSVRQRYVGIGSFFRLFFAWFAALLKQL
jgi:hypothetical protein